VKIKKIATATLLPAAIAGLTLSAGAAAMAAPVHHLAHPKSRNAQHGPAQHWVTAKRGETLSSIAAAHHLTWKELYATPPNYRVVHGPGAVRAGVRLRLPADPKLRAAQFIAVWRREAAIARADKARAAARAHAQAAVQSARTTANQPLTAGMSAFEQCVAWRESTDTPTDPDGLFGILPSTWAQLGYSGTAGQASVAQQKVAFNRLYAEYGTQPWAPSDGC
jgi:hypothetical protein